jgi:hypothetical protein
MIGMTTPPHPEAEAAHPHNRIRSGYARVFTRGQDNQSQCDVPAAAHCPEGVTETASTRLDRPKLRVTPGVYGRSAAE